MFNENPLKFAEELVKKHRYARLPRQLSMSARSLYNESLPDGYDINGSDNTIILTKDGTAIANGYVRIVIGDYGAFIEIPKHMMIREHLCAKKGEEYRYKDNSYRNSVKYFWYTAKDKSDIKIYHQQKTVNYADYRPGYFYICPHETKIQKTTPL